MDGIGFPVRGEDRRCVLLILGVNQYGQIELIAMDDGFRENTESWLTLLRNLKDRGFEAPCIAVGDGALGFWNAVTEVFPQTKHQRYWFHKMVNVLDKLPKSLQPRAKSMLHEISGCHRQKTRPMQLTMRLLRSTKPNIQRQQNAWKKILDRCSHFESTFATVRNRTYKVKGAFSSKTIVTMTFKLMQSAVKTWIRLRGFHHLDNVIKGVEFKDGKMQENGSICSNNEELIRKAA